MHIAYISPEYDPAVCRGGIGAYVRQMAALLAGRGVSVTVVHQSTRDFAERAGPGLRLVGVDLAHVRPRAVHALSREEGNRLWAVQARRMLGEVHAREPVDVIEVTDYYQEYPCFAVEPLQGAGGRAVPVVVQMHISQQVLDELNRASGREENGAYDGLVQGLPRFRKAYSPLMAAEVDRRWPGLAACRYVPPALGGKLDGAAEAARGPVAHELVFFANSLSWRKGPVHLAEALAGLAAEGVRPRVAVIGADERLPDGRLARAAMREIAGGAAELDFLERMPHAELFQKLRRARLAVIPSLFESFGFVVAEALAAGCAVVAGEGVGAARLFAGAAGSGYVCDVTDAAGFARCLARALRADDAQTAAAAAAQRAALAELSDETVHAAAMAYYREVVADGGRAGMEARLPGVLALLEKTVEGAARKEALRVRNQWLTLREEQRALQAAVAAEGGAAAAVRLRERLGAEADGGFREALLRGLLAVIEPDMLWEEGERSEQGKEAHLGGEHWREVVKTGFWCGQSKTAGRCVEALRKGGRLAFDAELRLYYAKHLAAAGRKEEAALFFEGIRACELPEALRGAYYYHCGRHLLGRGETGRAAQAMRRCLELEPTHRAAAECLERLGTPLLPV